MDQQNPLGTVFVVFAGLFLCIVLAGFAHGAVPLTAHPFPSIKRDAGFAGKASPTPSVVSRPVRAGGEIGFGAGRDSHEAKVQP
ncbi:hypothetical protein BZL41_27660 [Pseudomonas sp. PIC25]|uniref:hypothetical protein n=1 Tax=Pseudomonas sp. PIC25 TaxID=1958773 RepID=UPI000BAB4AD0|nr:hypothetical protein [Pseudomonas sp. PIC25]PAU51215.1 hypothetical protein BZL41_27660 [Pseudomonas sp. PIC25]